MAYSEARAIVAVELLARKHRILVHWRQQVDGFNEAHVATRQVWCLPPSAPYLYLAALHELGHMVSRRSRSAGDAGQVLTSEAAAWEWAVEQYDPTILPHLGKPVLKRITKAWGSYLPDGVS